MNLKHFYYRGYFEGRIKLSQPDKNGEPRKKNEEINEKAFRLKNATLTSTENVTPFVPMHILSIGTIQDLRLQVQNPGLLPGIGYPHEVGYPGELKLGFGFDHVSGLPVLPGSSVKGVLRSVFPQFKYDAEQPVTFIEESAPNKADKKKMQAEKAKYVVGLLRRLELVVPAESQLEKVKKLAHQLDLAIFCGFSFENEDKPVRLPMSKHDVFFDSLPVKFNEQKQLLGRDALTPHGGDPLKNPIPLPFLKVMPGVVFGFYFRLNDSQIGSLTITAEHKRRIFGEILCTVGAGAKTNVGYGQFDAVDSNNRIPKLAKFEQPKITNDRPLGGDNIPPAAQVLATVQKTQFSKSLVGKEVVGEVVSGDGVNPVRFQIISVAGFEGELSLKVADTLLNRFQTGKQFKLKVSKSVPERKELSVSQVSNYQPIN
jgi:CRISPR-associated protein Cmr6